MESVVGPLGAEGKAYLEVDFEFPGGKRHVFAKHMLALGEPPGVPEGNRGGGVCS